MFKYDSEFISLDVNVNVENSFILELRVTYPDLYDVIPSEDLWIDFKDLSANKPIHMSTSNITLSSKKGGTYEARFVHPVDATDPKEVMEVLRDYITLCVEFENYICKLMGKTYGS